MQLALQSVQFITNNALRIPKDGEICMSHETAPTSRTRVKRYHWLADYRVETLHGILDAMPVCQVGYLHEGAPIVTPTMQWRDGNRIYWHGSSASRFLRAANAQPVCVSVSIIDGLVMARAAYNCTLNYRSATIFGTAIMVSDPDEKLRQLKNFVDGLIDGHWERMRPVTAQELKATTLLSLDLAEASTKVRTGPSQDDEADYDHPVWAGVIPIRYEIGAPEADPRNLAEVAIPPEMTRFKMG
jgi:uncharacterized protein